MVSFVCDGCNETLKKAKVASHFCGCYSVSCIDCGNQFFNDEYAAHTSCISEAEKHQKSLYKPKRKRAGSQQSAAQTQQKPQKQQKQQKCQEQESNAPSKDSNERVRMAIYYLCACVCPRLCVFICVWACSWRALFWKLRFANRLLRRSSRKRKIAKKVNWFDHCGHLYPRYNLMASCQFITIGNLNWLFDITEGKRVHEEGCEESKETFEEAERADRYVEFDSQRNGWAQCCCVPLLVDKWMSNVISSIYSSDSQSSCSEAYAILCVKSDEIPNCSPHRRSRGLAWPVGRILWILLHNDGLPCSNTQFIAATRKFNRNFLKSYGLTSQ